MFVYISCSVVSVPHSAGDHNVCFCIKHHDLSISNIAFITPGLDHAELSSVLSSTGFLKQLHFYLKMFIDLRVSLVL